MSSIHHARRPRASPLWQILRHAWDDFLAGYENLHRRTMGPLRPDAVATVRAFLRCGDLAAEALVRHTDETAALDLLATELDSRNEWAATRAARALELLGEKALPKLDIMRDALNRRTSGFFGKGGPDPLNYGLEFSLTMALKALERR